MEEKKIVKKEVKKEKSTVTVKAIVYKNIETNKEFTVSDTRMISIFENNKDMKKVKDIEIEIDKKHFISTYSIK